MGFGTDGYLELSMLLKIQNIQNLCQSNPPHVSYYCEDKI